jgi:hypothetical protein
MAISLNALPTSTTLGGRLLLNPNPPAPPARPAPAPAAAPAPSSAPISQTLSPVAIQATPAATVFTTPIASIPVAQLPFPQPPILRPPILIPPTVFQPPPQNQTTTQLANSAITQLNNIAPAIVTQALNAIKSKSITGVGLIPYLERKVRIGEVLNDLAKDWTAPTRSDFADAFSMDPNNLNNDVADSVVSIAILNDKDLDNEILAENTPQTTPTDLTDNRRIVWQSVPAGTVLNPPYVILVAVEYQDVATAEDTVQAITNQLGTTGSGFRLPAAVIQKGVN